MHEAFVLETLASVHAAFALEVLASVHAAFALEVLASVHAATLEAEVCLLFAKELNVCSRSITLEPKLLRRRTMLMTMH